MSSSPIYKLSVPLPTPRRREVFFVPGRSEPLTAAIFGTAGRTLHNIRTPWCSSVSPPRRRTAPGKTLYKNCTSPLFSVPFSHINRNLTQKLQPPPLLCRFAPLIPYTKTAAAPFLRTSTQFPSAQDTTARRALHKNCTLSPLSRMFLQKACFLPSGPQNRPPLLPFCPAAPAFWHRLTPPSLVRYTKMHPCVLRALLSG